MGGGPTDKGLSLSKDRRNRKKEEQKPETLVCA